MGTTFTFLSFGSVSLNIVLMGYSISEYGLVTRRDEMAGAVASVTVFCPCPWAIAAGPYQQIHQKLKDELSIRPALPDLIVHNAAACCGSPLCSDLAHNVLHRARV